MLDDGSTLSNIDVSSPKNPEFSPIKPTKNEMNLAEERASVLLERGSEQD